MKITHYDSPYPAIYIDNFMPSEALVRAAAISFENYEDKDWVKYEGSNGQVQYCSKIPRLSSPECLIILDYIAANFDPNEVFNNITKNAFPDITHYGGGMMLTPNENKEGGYLGMHVDASAHGVNKNWKREYSVVLGLSEEYDETFDLLIHNGEDSHERIPYAFNRLWAFKCSEKSWHGISQITKGYSRKALGIMYWSKIDTLDTDITNVKAKFNNNLSFK
tara:strand:- start:172 stop:834 length:663 start_codon:yes stop_codon:yes gene_type:complete